MTRLTKSQFKAKFEAAKMKAFNIYFQNAPGKKGYLRSRILLVELENGFQIVNDTDYMEYTEEARTDGERNPNEGWFRRSTEAAFEMIVKEMNI